MAVGGRKHQQRSNQKPKSVHIDIQVDERDYWVVTTSKHSKTTQTEARVETELAKNAQRRQSADRQHGGKHCER